MYWCFNGPMISNQPIATKSLGIRIFYVSTRVLNFSKLSVICHRLLRCANFFMFSILKSHTFLMYR